jgi:hypothetical protein
MLDLCAYLSKIPPTGENDIGEPSYYDPRTDSCPLDRVSIDPSGVLSKKAGDIEDTWAVDLKVPPVQGYVGQDWPEGCPTVAENDQDYGCDLWIEVTNISLPNGPPIGCLDADVMQVFDRSGSIDSGELATLKTAGKAFVDALAPSPDGVHMGQTSFADIGSLDLPLTDDPVAIKAAIDALVSGGYTNLKEGIQLADGELESARDRDDVASPDFMVITTDGNPNRPTGVDARAVAKAAADTAKGKGVTIYVVGVGTTADTADWLKNNIASSPAHYFDAGDWDQLEAILTGLATCP